MSKLGLNSVVAASIAALWTSAFAQDPGALSGADDHKKQNLSSSTNADTIEEVIVIGSHIRGIVSGGSSPVITFDKEAISNTGVATMQQFFEKLPQNFGGGANGANVGNLGLDRDTGNNFGQGSTINLRGLGTGTTLTLVNGHRVASSNRYQYVDVSLIPMSAVERVEILSDGASAIYGSDAVAGVVNIVMRKDFTGYETGLRYGSVTEGGMEEYQLSQVGGWSWADGRALVSYEFVEQTNLSALDKDFSSKVAFTPYDLYPGSKRHSLYMDGLHQITETLALNLTGSYAKREMDTTIASRWDVTNLFPQTQQYDVFAGLTLDLPQQWQARLNAGYGENEVRYVRTTVEGGVANTAPPTNMISSIGYLDLIADGYLLSLPAGAIKAAVGANFTRDEYDFFDHRKLESPFNPIRDITSAFGEVNVPLLINRPAVRNLSLTVAARYDDYSDFGSTTNPKYGLLWEATEALSFRGSYGRSYRAPVFQDMQPNNFAFVTSVSNPNAPSGSTILMQIANGNPDLGPERAETWTTGFSFSSQSIPGFTVQANYYQIDYSDRIDAGYPGDPFALFSQSTAPYADLLTFNPTDEQIQQAVQLGLSGLGVFVYPSDLKAEDTEVILDNRVRNNALTAQDGVDLDASYSVDIGTSLFTLNVAAWYIIDSTRQVTSASPEADTLNLVYLPADLKMRGGVTVTQGKLMTGLFVNHVGSYKDPSNLIDQKVDSWTTLDLNVKYRFAGETSLALNVQNLLDKDPPFIVNAIGTGYDPTNATALGRFVSMSLNYGW
jgi:outer membrane receptor protein involved in Fe transport